ncbi:hypothetical protein SAMN05660703_0908 [Cellulophaga tyrosinoxydans]|uniref:Uncharacterized protein n=1 Tax=Cellulophaga tyrosinoxydans TaxID=504486 RepID=A0A1W1YUD0_9FLAO|nr:hypothetical protein SAMN05660703_0908 [Cellulophaga tyrosinoxydans]
MKMQSKSKVICLNSNRESIQLSNNNKNAPNVINLRQRELNNIIKDLTSISRD